MPKLFVVGEQKNLIELAPALLRARTDAVTRRAALAAIVKANPSLDFDNLKPGAVVLVPPVGGVRVLADDPGAAVADDLVARVRDAMGALAADAETAEGVRIQEKKEAQDLFGTAIVKRLSASVPELAANVESVRDTFKQDDMTSRQALSDIRDSLDSWSADLDVLRAIL